MVIITYLAGTGISTSTTTAGKQIEAFLFVLFAVGSVGFVTERFTGSFANISGRVSGAVGSLNKRFQDMRGRKAQKSWTGFKRGERFNPNGVGKFLGGGIVNRVGAHVGAGMHNYYGFGGRGRAAMAGNMASSKEAMSRESEMFGAFSEDEATMLALSAGNNQRFLESLSYFQDTNGDVDMAKIRAARQNAAAIIGATGGGRRLQVAALDAVAKSGKGINTPEEMQRLSRRVASGGGGLARYNDKLYGNVYFGAMHGARSSGNLAAGRPDVLTALGEAGASQYAGIKEPAAQQLFARREDIPGAAGVTTSHWRQAALDLQDQWRIQNQRAATAATKAARDAAARAREGIGYRIDSMYDALYDAQYNPSIGASSKQYISQTISLVQNDPQWQQAAGRYARRMQPNQQSDKRLKHNIHFIATTATGIRLYRFRYLWSNQEYVGVMAQDLIHTHPEALFVDNFGFYRVDYSTLGMRMMTIQDWETEQANVVGV